MSDELAWTAEGPRSQRYDDIYFSQSDGLAESRAVFLQGCGLPQAWTGRAHFTVAELGFGTGLNLAALLQLWRATRPTAGRLSIFSVEAHPISRDEAARALSGWGEMLGEAAQVLLDAWPDGRRGFHRLDLPGWAATLDVYIGEVGEALAAWSGPADAWFLDGFAPSRNPQMWRPEVLCEVARLSAPGARLASFTVAGHVRRGLAAAGFDVHKRPGFGAKRERLEAILSLSGEAERARAHRPRRVAIVGGGIAGAALARAFHRQGVACTLVESRRAGAGASGNPGALVTPRLDAGFGPSAELHAQAFAYAVAAYRRETPEAVLATGAYQLADGARAAERFARIAGWDGFAARTLRPVEGAEAAERLGEAGSQIDAALEFADALVVEPLAILAPWFETADSVVGTVAELQAKAQGWRCLDASGALLVEADAVCLAAGMATADFVSSSGLRPIRGQAEFTHAPVGCGPAAAWGAYAIPLRGDGLLFGASHRRGDAGADLRPEETAANFEALGRRRPALAQRVHALEPHRLESRAAVRASTPDHLPLAGAEGRPGLFILGGLGGRGFTLAPLLAEHVAALAMQAPSPLSADLAHRLRPLRFQTENRLADQPF